MTNSNIAHLEPGKIQCETAAQGAAVGLLGLMTGISEECWHAGWMQNLEFDLWNATPGMIYGHGVISERQCQLLRLLSEEGGGWWTWNRSEMFIPLPDWQAARSKEYVIDGERIGSLQQFYEEISRVLIPGKDWGRNLDAFDEILGGGFGTPEGFTLRWRESAVSRAKLGYAETVTQLELRIQHCHPANRDHVRGELALARSGKGPIVFDWVLAIIREHGPGGKQAGHNVLLILD